MSSGWSPRWAISTSVWVARSKRNTPPKWIRATPHTTSSVRSAVRARSSPLPVATTTACSASSSRLRRLSGASPPVAPCPRSDADTIAIPTASVSHHREHRTRRQPRDRRLESLEAPPDDHHAGGHRRDAENVRPPVDDGEPRGGLRRASDRPHEELTRGRYLDEWGTTRVHDQQ